MEYEKIRLYGVHFCTLTKGLIKEFESLIDDININKWVKNEIGEILNIQIKSKDDVKEVKDLCEAMHYKDAGEWVSERMRHHINLYKKSTQRKEEYYCYRVASLGRKLYMVKDTYNMDVYEVFPTWDSRMTNQLIIFNSFKEAQTYVEHYFSPYLDIQVQRLI